MAENVRKNWKSGVTNMWEPETDACNECKECGYFLDDYWNCQGEPVPCFDFYPKPGSKLKKIEFIVEPENIPDKTEI